LLNDFLISPSSAASAIADRSASKDSRKAVFTPPRRVVERPFSDL
jgi:hypothetical protein